MWNSELRATLGADIAATHDLQRGQASFASRQTPAAAASPRRARLAA
jgi:hypothetical protein